jgi:uncharacterized protein (DUF1330 family)
MTAYIWATVKSGEPEKFMAYAKAAAQVAAGFGGEYVVRGVIEEVFEGECEDASRAILIRFPDADAARAYMSSDGYKDAKALRADAGGAVHSRLVVAP